MTPKSIGWCLVIVAGVVSRSLFGAEPPCVTATFYGVDDPFEQAIREQLRNELGAPVTDREVGGSCWRLVIEMRGGTARILLEGRRVMKTEIQLNDVLPALWARAIALSSAGLWVLSQTPEHRGESSKTDEAKPGRSGRTASDDAHSKTRTASNAPDAGSKTGGALADDHRTAGQIRLHFLAGARLIPKFWGGMIEILPGIGVLFGSFCLDLSLIGLWGRKSTDIGRIFNAGIGGRLTLRGQALRRKAFAMWIGPAVEAVGLFGYGREADEATSHTAVAPVVTLFLLLGGSLALAPRVDAYISLGGGWTVLYFHMQADGENVSGMAGGLATFVVGIDFGI